MMFLYQAPPPWLIGWIALAASAVSLTIAVATFVLTQRRPRIRMVLPHRIRLSATPATGVAWLYVQPIFVNVGRSTRADVIDDVRIDLFRTDHFAVTHFEYVEKSKTTWDERRREVHVEYVDEAAPIIVAQNSVRSDMLTFKTTSASQFTPGEYDGILTAKLIGSSVSLRAAFSVRLAEEHVSVWAESSGRRFAMLPIKRI